MKTSVWLFKVGNLLERRTLTAFGVASLALFSAGLSQAAISACAGSATGTLLNSGVSGAANGCAVVDLSFQNISLSGANGTGGFATSTIATTGVYASSTAFSGNTAGTATLTFDSTTAANADWIDGGAGGTLAATFSWVAVAHSSGSYGAGPTNYTAPNVGFFWYFDKVTPFINGAVPTWSSGTQSVVVTTTFCLGAASTAGCAAPNTGTLIATIAEGSSISYTCGTASTTLYTCGAAGVLDTIASLRATQIAFSSVIAANEGNGSVQLTNFGFSYDQLAATPEPSTFGLLGSALLGLGFLARRRRKV